MRILLSTIALALTLSTHAQVTFDVPEGEPKGKNLFAASLSGSFGFVSPDAVNNYIEQDIVKRLGGTPFLSFGDSDIKFALSLGFALYLRPNPRLRVSIPLEYGRARTQVILNNNASQPITYTMERFTTGGSVDVLFPAKKHDRAFYLGGGLLYHSMSFEDKSGSTISPRAEFGYIFYGSKGDYECFARSDFAKANAEGLVIDFTGLHVGFRLTF